MLHSSREKVSDSRLFYRLPSCTAAWKGAFRVLEVKWTGWTAHQHYTDVESEQGSLTCTHLFRSHSCSHASVLVCHRPLRLPNQIGSADGGTKQVSLHLRRWMELLYLHLANCVMRAGYFGGKFAFVFSGSVWESSKSDFQTKIDCPDF